MLLILIVTLIHIKHSFQKVSHISISYFDRLCLPYSSPVQKHCFALSLLKLNNTIQFNLIELVSLIFESCLSVWKLSVLRGSIFRDTNIVVISTMMDTYYMLSVFIPYNSI